MDNKGQTTFEYLLLVGGVVILAVIIIYMLTTGVQSSSQEVNATIGGTTEQLTNEANAIAENISPTSGLGISP